MVRLRAFTFCFFVTLFQFAFGQSGQPLAVAFENGLKISDPNSNTSIKLNGRLQVDYVNAELDSETIVNDAEVKRAWLTLSGTNRDWFFLHRFDIDPEPSGSELSSFIEYRGFGPLAMIGVGRHKEPLGMRWRTSIKNTATPERSAISHAHTLGRSVGVLARGYGKTLGYEAGVFEGEKEDEENNANYAAFTGRVFTPIAFSDQHLLHLGVGASVRSEKDVVNVEIAYLKERFHLQTEWFQTDWEGIGANGVAKANGYTVDLGWFVTSDAMSYQRGAFQRIVPKANGGAWQLVLRVDKGFGNYSDIQLDRGEGRQFALGVNWFANSNTRLGVSYSQGKLDAQMENLTEQNPTGRELRARLQFAF